MPPKIIVRHSLVFTLAIGLCFIGHLAILHLTSAPLFNDKIVWAYLLNFVLGLGLFWSLYRWRVKYHEQLGYLFMMGSMVKFLLFFILFYPSYKQDNQITTLEFAAFYVPYAVSLFFETFGVIKFLKK